MTIEIYFNTKRLLTSATLNTKFQFLFTAVLPVSSAPSPLITGSFRGFFLLFLFDYFGDSRNIFPHFFILYAISLRENTQWSESWESTENNSLATSSSTWQTEDYFFSEKFYLKTLTPKETQWKHLLYISHRFLLINLREIPAVCEQLRSGLYFRRHIYLITDGSIVTSSITLYKCMRYIIITRRKPYCLADCSMSLAFRNTKLCKIEMVSLR